MSVIKKMIVLISILAFLGIGPLGCDREGPAERAGEKVDDAVDRAGDKLEDTGEEAGEKLEETGEKLNR